MPASLSFFQSTLCSAPGIGPFVSLFFDYCASAEIGKKSGLFRTVVHFKDIDNPIHTAELINVKNQIKICAIVSLFTSYIVIQGAALYKHVAIKELVKRILYLPLAHLIGATAGKVVLISVGALGGLTVAFLFYQIYANRQAMNTLRFQNQVDQPLTIY